MNPTLTKRLNSILPRITSREFLSSEGIGNEIACYIFDYPAECELQVRDHLETLLGRLASHHSDLDVLHLNLLEVVLDYLKQRGLLDKALEMEIQKGGAALLKALRGPLAAEKIRDFIAEKHQPADHDLFLVSGVGSVWPILRAHSLLNCVHSVLGTTPLVMFYPGTYDGTTLRFFGQIAPAAAKAGSKPYYRAFILIPEETEA